MKNTLIRWMLISCMILPLCGCIIPKSLMSLIDPDKAECVTLRDAMSMDSGNAIKMTATNNGVSTPDTVLVWLYKYITYVTWYAAQGIYEGIVDNEDFNRVLVGLATLTIAFYSIGTLLGIASYKPYDATMFLLKLTIVMAFATSWEPFRDVFYIPLEGELEMKPGGGWQYKETGLIPTFIQAATGLLPEINTVVSTDPDAPKADVLMLGEIDNVLSMFASLKFWKVIMATLVSGLMGPFYALLLIFMVISYFWAVMAAMQVLFVSIIARALLYAIAPFFFICLLFKQTRDLFFAWAELILSYTLQPILLFVWLGMINAEILDFLKALPSDPDVEVCYLPFINIPVVSILQPANWWLFANDTKSGPEARGVFADIPLHGWYIFGVIAVSYFMHMMTDWTTKIGTALASTGSNLGGVQAYGFETVKAATYAPFKYGAALARGAALGAKDDDGVRRKLGLAGGLYETAARRRPFNVRDLMNDIVGGTQQAGKKARKKIGDDLHKTFLEDFGAQKKRRK